MRRSIEFRDRKIAILSEKINAHLLFLNSIRKEASSVKQVVDNVQLLVDEKEEAGMFCSNFALRSELGMLEVSFKVIQETMTRMDEEDRIACSLILANQERDAAEKIREDGRLPGQLFQKLQAYFFFICPFHIDEGAKSSTFSPSSSVHFESQPAANAINVPATEDKVYKSTIHGDGTRRKRVSSKPRLVLVLSDEPTANPNHTAWVCNDAHVRSLLTSTISEASFQHVQGETSRDLWLSLERAYEPTSFSRVSTIKTQLLRISMQGDESATTYLNRAQSLYDSLANLRHPMPESDLPATTTSNPPQVFYTNRSRGRGNRLDGGRQGNYHVNSHSRPPVAHKNQFSWASNHNMVYGTCNRCGIGHPPSQCPNHDLATMRPRQPSANFTDFRSQASTSAWLPDTGSSNHVSPDLAGFDNSEPYFGEDNLHVGNGKGLPILHIGSTRFYSPSTTFYLKNILHVPEIKTNLLSVQKFCQDNHIFFEFHDSFFLVKDKSTHTILLMGPSNGGLYSFRLPKDRPIKKVAFSTSRASSTVWHQRLGHPHQQLFNSMLSKYCLPFSSNKSISHCNACSIGKSSKLHLFPSIYKSSHVLDLIYYDVWGPAPVPSFDGHLYFLLCVDNFTRFMWIFPLKQKSDVFDLFSRFIVMAERQFKTKLKAVQTDGGGEFRKLTPHLSSMGIQHRFSCPHTSEQNGVVERRQRHVVETGLTLLAQSHVPQRFWHFAFDTAVYLINCMPSRNNSNTSPFELLFHHKPDFSFLRVFGSQCYPHLRAYNSHKMDFRSISCVFLGYSTAHHGYRCFDPISDRLYLARHVRFNESSFPFASITSPVSTIPSSASPYVSSYPSFHSHPEPTVSPPPPAPIQPSASNSPPTSTHSSSSVTPPSPHPTSSTAPPPRTRPPNLRPNPKRVTPFNKSSFHTTSLHTPTEPTSFTHANNDPHWQQAMATEYSALMRNGTWSLVPRVPGANLVDCKWVYKLKRDQTGAITRHKARLVAKGYHQQPGIDYMETFSLVVKSTTIRVVLSLAVTQRWSLRQLDVQNAFLHGDLKETVYMTQPQGFVDPTRPDHVCLLHKSLYGLKQAPRAWLRSWDLWVMGPPRFRCAIGDSPLFDNPVKYRQIVGALQYVTLSRPDLAFAVNKVCEFMHSPTQNHWSAVKRILRYLQGTSDFGLWLHHNSGSHLQAYTDAYLQAFSDWAGCPDDRRSTGGFAIYLGNNLISWAARKQKTVSRSST
ncbi:hypothetical protein E3N88_42185 [Mikania micrantha]|uniref:Integrase catalytic domain-containing protein n=1 Tax=Mikania micrantha TaxID=192012 RepID=A0A5N6LKQ2_9ASTR|nr:hypothetical protein E3N88_42185 [Mikania micrantha]